MRDRHPRLLSEEPCARGRAVRSPCDEGGSSRARSRLAGSRRPWPRAVCDSRSRQPRRDRLAEPLLLGVELRASCDQLRCDEEDERDDANRDHPGRVSPRAGEDRTDHGVPRAWSPDTPDGRRWFIGIGRRASSSTAPARGSSTDLKTPEIVRRGRPQARDRPRSSLPRDAGDRRCLRDTPARPFRCDERLRRRVRSRADDRVRGSAIALADLDGGARARPRRSAGRRLHDPSDPRDAPAARGASSDVRQTDARLRAEAVRGGGRRHRAAHGSERGGDRSLRLEAGRPPVRRARRAARPLRPPSPDSRASRAGHHLASERERFERGGAVRYGAPRALRGGARATRGEAAGAGGPVRRLRGVGAPLVPRRRGTEGRRARLGAACGGEAGHHRGHALGRAGRRGGARGAVRARPRELPKAHGGLPRGRHDAVHRCPPSSARTSHAGRGTTTSRSSRR